MALRLIVRPFELDDRDTVIDVLGNCLRTTPPERIWHAMQHEWLRGATIELACLGETGEVVGVTCYSVRKTDCQILVIAVRHCFRRGRAGRHLLRGVLDRTHSRITAWVPSTARAAIAFFRAQGFFGEFVRTPEFDRLHDYFHFVYRRRPFEAASAATDEAGR